MKLIWLLLSTKRQNSEGIWKGKGHFKFTFPILKVIQPLNSDEERLIEISNSLEKDIDQVEQHFCTSWFFFFRVLIKTSMLSKLVTQWPYTLTFLIMEKSTYVVKF